MKRIMIVFLLLWAVVGCKKAETDNRGGLLLLLGLAGSAPCSAQNSSGFVICVPAGVAR